MSGSLVVSLDFELFWGMQDCSTLKTYQDNVLGGRKAVPLLLELFRKHGIHVTWATVGFMFANNYDEVKRFFPENKLRPTYREAALSTYRCFEKIGKDEREAPCFYAPSLIEQVAATAGMEIGSHTFSHYYCREKGQTVEEFEADLQAAKEIMKEKGYPMESIILPKNQCEKAHTDRLSKNGFIVYRGEEKDWIHRMKYGIVMRGLRLMDSYVSLTGPQCYTIEEAEEDAIYNFRGSRFLRPYNSKLAFLENLKIRRLKKQMKYAAKHDLIFHMWWHPHNFGVNQKENLRNLDEILEYFKKMREKYGMRSMNMEELAEEAGR